MNEIAKILIVTGGLLVLAGVLLVLAGKIPGLGRLPGDIYLKGKNTAFYFPLMTCVLLSLLLSLILNFFNLR